MMDIDWKKFVAGVAPMLGTALGGPMAGAAVKVLAGAIFGDETKAEADVAAAIVGGQLTGEQIVAINSAEQQFVIRMRELDIDLAKLNQAAEDARLKDVQDARSRQIATKDTMPQQIFYILLVVFALEVWLLVNGKMPTDEFSRALITRAFSMIEIGLTSAMTYFIGSSRGSKASGDAVRKIAERTGG